MLFELGELPTAVEYLQAQQVRRQLKQDFNKAFEEVDVLAAPTLPMLPNDIGDDFANINGEKVDLINNIIRFMGPENITELTVLTMTCGLIEGLSVGLQLIGLALRETNILNDG